MSGKSAGVGPVSCGVYGSVPVGRCRNPTATGSPFGRMPAWMLRHSWLPDRRACAWPSFARPFCYIRMRKPTDTTSRFWSAIRRTEVIRLPAPPVIDQVIMHSRGKHATKPQRAPRCSRCVDLFRHRMAGDSTRHTVIGQNSRRRGLELSRRLSEMTGRNPHARSRLSFPAIAVTTPGHDTYTPRLPHTSRQRLEQAFNVRRDGRSGNAEPRDDADTKRRGRAAVPSSVAANRSCHP